MIRKTGNITDLTVPQYFRYCVQRNGTEPFQIWKVACSSDLHKSPNKSKSNNTIYRKFSKAISGHWYLLIKLNFYYKEKNNIKAKNKNSHQTKTITETLTKKKSSLLTR